MMALLVLLVIGHDLMFVNLICELVFQAQLLNHALEGLRFGENGDADVEGKMRECLGHHDFLVRNALDLVETLEGYHLVHCAIVVVTICIELTIIVDK